MSIYSYIKSDHAELKTLLQRIENEGPAESDTRADLFNEFKIKLLLHSKAEEHSFYKALKQRRTVKELTGHNEGEHQNIENLLHKLIQPDLTGSDWFIEFLHLKKCVRSHFETEEQNLFAKAQKVFSTTDEQNLEQQMKNQKRHERENHNIRLREAVTKPDYMPVDRSKGNGASMQHRNR